MEPNNQATQQPQATPPTHPANPNPTPTPPQGPLDPNGNPLPPLTRGQKIKYCLIALFFVAIIGGIIAWTVTSSNKEDARVNDIKANGIMVTGTANGEVHEYTNRSRRGGASIQYKAIYEYVEQGETLEAPEDALTAIGEKLYDTKEEVEALKGQKADVYYNANGGTFVEDDK